MDKRDNSDNSRIWLGLLSGLITLVTVYLAADPEAPARLWYQLRLWLAYRSPEPNQARLERMRALYRAGHYEADAKPTLTRISDIAS